MCQLSDKAEWDESDTREREGREYVAPSPSESRGDGARSSRKKKMLGVEFERVRLDIETRRKGSVEIMGREERESFDERIHVMNGVMEEKRKRDLSLYSF